MKEKYTNAISLNRAMTYSNRSEILIILKGKSGVSRQDIQDELGIKLPSPVHKDIRFLLDSKMIELTNYGAFKPLYKLSARGENYLNMIVNI